MYSCFPVVAALREVTREALNTCGPAEGISEGLSGSGQWIAVLHLLQEGTSGEL